VSTPQDRIRQTAKRANRIAVEDDRTYGMRLADALTDLADVIEEERHPGVRMQAWSLALDYVGSRAQDDFQKSTEAQ
jgi:hypothetical protein